jgi:hypothetical protein
MSDESEPRASAPSWVTSAVARALVVLFIGGAIVVALIAVVWLVFSPFRPVANERPELGHAVPSAVSQAGDGGTVDMRALATFDWDRMYVFGAYTSDAEVSETLGFEWGTGDTLRLPNDGFVLLIFAKEQGVTGWAVINDYQSTGPLVQFGDSSLRTPILREQATFRAALQPDRTSGGSAIYRLDCLGSVSLASRDIGRR